MTKYAVRTCAMCGVKKPQNEMRKVSVRREFARGKAGVSGMTWFGLLFKGSGSKGAIKRWFFNTSQRNYSTHKEVWSCGGCSKKMSVLGTNSGCIGKILRVYGLILLISLCFILVGEAVTFLGGD